MVVMDIFSLLEVIQEHGLSDKEETEDKDAVVSPISPISPVAPISPISPNPSASDDEEGNDMEIEEGVEKIEEGNDVDLEDNVEQESEKDASEEKHATNSPKEIRTPSDDENVSDLNIEETAEVNDEVESTNKQSTNDEEEPGTLEGDNETSSLNISEDSNTVEAQDDGNKDVSSAKNSSLEESDLLNITEISDLSVDLTGDEAAIVDDILQNVGDGELLPGEEKAVAEDQEPVTGKYLLNDPRQIKVIVRQTEQKDLKNDHIEGKFHFAFVLHL